MLIFWELQGSISCGDWIIDVDIGSLDDFRRVEGQRNREIDEKVDR